MFSGEVRFTFRYGGIATTPPTLVPGQLVVLEPLLQVDLEEACLSCPAVILRPQWCREFPLFPATRLATSLISPAGSPKRPTPFPNQAHPAAVEVGAAAEAVPVPVLALALAVPVPALAVGDNQR